MTAEGNRTCIIMLRLSDFKSQASLSLFLRHYELINENVSYFLINQWKTKTFTNDDISARIFIILETKTKGYDVIGINVFLRKLMRFLRKKQIIWCLLYYH